MIACDRGDQSNAGNIQALASSGNKTASVDGTELITLSEMISVLFPGPGIEDRLFLAAARQVQSVASAMGSTQLMITGIGELEASGWATLNPDQRTEALKSIEASEFFQFVRLNATAALYGNQEVGERYGYEGESFSKGGYVNRGVNDLTWLPEPTETQ